MAVQEKPSHEDISGARWRHRDIFYVQDPVRQEVPAAVATCIKAGIFVRMVTGDNVHTAKHIARECGILTDDGIALEGPAFRVMSQAELIPMLPRLQVGTSNQSPCMTLQGLPLQSSSSQDNRVQARREQSCPSLACWKAEKENVSLLAP